LGNKGLKAKGREEEGLIISEADRNLGNWRFTGILGGNFLFMGYHLKGDLFGEVF